RADQQGCRPGQGRVTLPGAAAPGARRADHRRLAGHGKQSPGEVLHAHGAGSRKAQTRDPRLGGPDDSNREDPRSFTRRVVMAFLRRLIGGFRGLFQKTRVEQELDDELRAFLETAVEEKVRSGLSREEAARAARM